VSYWGRDDGTRDPQYDRLGRSWIGAVGASDSRAPVSDKWLVATGGSHELGTSYKVGAFASFFHEDSATYYDDGREDYLWVEAPGKGMSPQYYQGTPSGSDFRTGLYDVTRGTENVRWGGLGTIGLSGEGQSIGLTWLHTRVADDSTTISTDTRGKEYFFPGYDVNDPMGSGNEPSNRLAAPYIRSDTLTYTERTTSTLQLGGTHTLPTDGWSFGKSFKALPPEFSWIVAASSASMNQPDKRQFSAIWLPDSYNPGFPPFVLPFIMPETWLPYKPAANFTLGNLQHIWQRIDESSDEYSLALKFPFEQWSRDKGYWKSGFFEDRVRRRYHQDTFSNFNDNSGFNGPFDPPWSSIFDSQDHPISASTYDVDYRGRQRIVAVYSMLDLPLSSWLTLSGGARFESTSISIVNNPEKDATWFPPGAATDVLLKPGDADVTFKQRDLLPAASVTLKPSSELTLRGSYSRTVAHQTFKELSPILQQEFLGGPIFVGNPDLRMSKLTNYDLRADYAPYDGGLLSFSWFRKEVKDPIEYVQRLILFTFTEPRNYPDGVLQGYEIELRQSLGHFFESLSGVSLGANATIIHSRVTLPDDEAAQFDAPAIRAPMHTRDMTSAPDHIFNLYATYDLPDSGTQFAIFYTLQGDTLLRGAGVSNGFLVPSVYAKQYGTLNLSVSQTVSDHVKLQFEAKNVTNPRIEQVYRSRYIGHDKVTASYRKGVVFSVGLSVTF
jgi:TonB-dependent receptor